MDDSPHTVVAPPQEATFRLRDGVELFYRAWLPSEPAEQALFLFHRGHEHSGRFADVVAALDLRRTAIFAWDARGHGRSPGVRGQAPSLTCVIKDIDEFVTRLAAEHGFCLDRVCVLGHSVGAVGVAAWVHDYAPPIRAMVLISPALRVKLYVPLAVPGLRLLHKLRGNRAFVTSYVRSNLLTHDPEQAKQYDADPLISKQIAVNILLDLYDTSTRLIDDAAAIRVPTLLLAAGRSDWVVRLDAQEKFFTRLGSPHKQMRVFEEMHHDLLHERDRRPVLDEVRAFLESCNADPPRRAALVDADARGFTRDEHERLSRPLPALSPQGLSFALQRRFLQSLGKLSEGVALGWQTGFNSGQTLDYVYANQSNGRTPLGRLIDRVYLNSLGWRGIRTRKVHLESQLRSAIEQLQQAGEPVRLLDVAAGCGRYVLDVLAGLPPGAVESVLLRDFDLRNVAAGRALVLERNTKSVRFEQGDAFDEESLAAVEPKPNVAIVSGLFELFPENDKPLATLRGLARAMQAGGYLIYTGQPWHPQLEMIARVLVHPDGRPWVMRRRTQEELDDLVRFAGFTKQAMEIDNHGIFTVSLAKIEASS